MWCTECRHSRPHPPSDVEVRVVKREEYFGEGFRFTDYLDEVVVVEEELRERDDPSGFIKRLKEERLRMIRDIYEELRGVYPRVVWCTKIRRFKVCNPDKPTTYVDMRVACPYFEAAMP